MTICDPERVSVSSSASCGSCISAPERTLQGAQSALVIPFPRHRSPHHDAEGSGSVGLGTGSLRGVGVLVVEDDFIVAFDMQSMLEEEGARVIGPLSDLPEALAKLAAARPDIRVAVLDVNLHGEYVFPLAIELRRAGIPFVFATAYADDERLFPAELRDVPRLAKPVLPNVLLGHVRRLLG